MRALQSVKFIVNPAAGHGIGGKYVKDLEKAAVELGMDLSLELTKYPGHATELAAAVVGQQVGFVGVMGGDGTPGQRVHSAIFAPCLAVRVSPYSVLWVFEWESKAATPGHLGRTGV